MSKINTTITITWGTDDILSICPNLNFEQSLNVLTRLKKDHDACIGINWDVIKATCESMYPELF